MTEPAGRLIIEYALDASPPRGLDGMRPGYRFRPPVEGFDERTLNAVWRQAMPRGQGWGADALTGARSLKCFPLAGGLVAVSNVVVTDQADEMGRRGIRRAEIDLLDARGYPAWLEGRLADTPAAIREAAGQRLAGALLRRMLNRALLRGGRQVALAHPYRSADAWQVIEALVLRLVTSPGVRLLEGWGPHTSFTTLALETQDESQIVALPLEAARSPAAIVVR